MRTKPVTRDSAVPTATTALDRTSDVSDSVGFDPGSVRPRSSRSSRSSSAYDRSLASASYPRRGRLVTRVARRAARSGTSGAACCAALLASTVDVPTPPEREEHDRTHGQEDSHTAHERRADRDARRAADGQPVGGGHRHEHRRRARAARLDRDPHGGVAVGRQEHVALGAVGEEQAVALELEVDGDRLVAGVLEADRDLGLARRDRDGARAAAPGSGRGSRSPRSRST